MKRFLEDPTTARGVEMIVWQVMTLFWPIVNGVMYVLADALWTSFLATADELAPSTTYDYTDSGTGYTVTVTLAPASDMIKAYFYFFGVVDGKTFSTYLMDYIMYGLIPETITVVADYVDSDFYAIPLALGAQPDDLFCYYLNGYDPESNPDDLPIYGMSYLWDASNTEFAGNT